MGNSDAALFARRSDYDADTNAVDSCDTGFLIGGLRGGGGNFGVVTSLEFRLHSVAPTVYGGQLVYPIAHAGALLRHFADFISVAPDDLYVEVRLEARPGGEGDVRFDVCYCGPPSEAERWLSPLRQLGEPLQDQLAPAHYSDLQRMNDGSNPHGRGYYVKSGYLRVLTPAVIDAVVDTSASSPPTAMHVGFVPFGGAIARVKPTATAYWHRDPTHALVMVVSWRESSDAERSTQWAHETWAKLEPLTTGFYVNLAGKEDRVRRQLPATRCPQEAVRSGQSFPPQRQHQAGVIEAECRGGWRCQLQAFERPLSRALPTVVN
jgi:hypothetical protein